MAERLTDYLKNAGIRVKYLHSEIDTLERMEIIRDLRMGLFDVLVGINLLREGLDVPEVSLVAILDADKQGFLRTETSLIQTIGRAARNVNGRVIMYADSISPAMKSAIEETDEDGKYNRNVQREKRYYAAVDKEDVRAVIEATKQIEPEDEFYKGRSPLELTKKELAEYLKKLEAEMKQAAQDLQFERAAELRNRIFEYKVRQ